MKRSLLLLAVPVLLAGCANDSRTPVQPETATLVKRVANATQTYVSGSTPVTAYDPIIPAAADPNWVANKCVATPQYGPNAAWSNPHPAVTGLSHPWINDYFTGAGWINAWGTPGYTPLSQGPSGQSWTKYTTQVEGNGSFVIRLLADNCSWIYLDRTLVGVQGNDLSKNSYGLTLNGTHTLEFIIFDGGGAAGGKFMLETTTNPPPPLNNDLDNDGHVNDADAFPLDPTRWEPEVVDATPPTITPTVTGTMGANGWYTSDVDVSWAVADAESDIGSTSGCDAVTVSSDTNGASFTCSATSVGGTASQTVTVKRDATKPAIGYSGNAGSYTVDQDVAISCTASDAMSGLASSTCANVAGAAYTFASGLNSFSASAQDNAGNANAASASFMVSATSGSVCSLVERWVSNVGVANSMCVKLRHGSYGAFRNELSAQSGKKISAANAAILLRLVNLLG